MDEPFCWHAVQLHLEACIDPNVFVKYSVIIITVDGRFMRGSLYINAEVKVKLSLCLAKYHTMNTYPLLN